MISFGKVHPIWHKDNQALLHGRCYVQEKVDGSQFSFAWDEELGVRFASRSRLIPADDEGMFKAGCDAIREIRDGLVRGRVYHGEYLAKPRHNILCYERVPKRHVALWGVKGVDGSLMPPCVVASEATQLGMEAVPILKEGSGLTVEGLVSLMDTSSFLGATTIEGVVVKRDQMCGKLVSERFKEFKGSRSKDRRSADPVTAVVAEVACEPRFHKIVQHMKEAGEWKGDYSDIPWLCREIVLDVEDECSDVIRDRLWKHFWPKIRKGLPAGIVAWYKEECERGGIPE